MDEAPGWWTNASRLWMEDDSGVPDAEGINMAWVRIFGSSRLAEVVKEKFDAGDADFVLYESGRIAGLSYPGNSEIRILEGL